MVYDAYVAVDAVDHCNIARKHGWEHSIKLYITLTFYRNNVFSQCNIFPAAHSTTRHAEILLGQTTVHLKVTINNSTLDYTSGRMALDVER